MNIELHIERLILNGLPYNHTQGAQLQQALEAELSQLLASGAFDAQIGEHSPHLRTDMLEMGQAPNITGTNLARTVFERIETRGEPQ
jgi:hypothetical protein